MKVYLAAPLFTRAERVFNSVLGSELINLGHEVWLPQDQSATFQKCIDGINWADVLVAVVDGPDPDSGTSFECGVAYAKGKKTFQIRTDPRGVSDGDCPYNFMLSKSASVFLLFYNLDTERDIAAALHEVMYQ